MHRSLIFVFAHFMRSTGRKVYLVSQTKVHLRLHYWPLRCAWMKKLTRICVPTVMSAASARAPRARRAAPTTQHAASRHARARGVQHAYARTLHTRAFICAHVHALYAHVYVVNHEYAPAPMCVIASLLSPLFSGLCFFGMGIVHCGQQCHAPLDEKLYSATRAVIFSGAGVGKMAA